MKKAAVFGVIKDGKSDINEKYFEHISRSGAKGYAIYPQDPQKAVEDFDCLIICGGGDINPKYYGQIPYKDNIYYNTVLDEYENQIIKAFINSSKPVMGICRGMQAINIALGGTLIQDIPEFLGLYHQSSPNECLHEIKISKESKLSSVLGLRVIVNSNHHQCIHRLGKGLNVIAASHDGIIEAIEGNTLPVFAVQWHPERMCGNDVFDYFFSSFF